MKDIEMTAGEVRTLYDALSRAEDDGAFDLIVKLKLNKSTKSHLDTIECITVIGRCTNEYVENIR